MPYITPPLDAADNPWVELSLQGTANLLSATDAGNTASGSVGSWVGTGCTLSQTGPTAPDGSFPLRLTSSGAGNISAVTGTQGVVPKQVYTGVVALEAVTTGRSTQAQLVWKDGGGATISTSGGLYSSDSGGAYTIATVTDDAPPTAASVTLQVLVVGTANTEQHYVASRAILPGSSTTWGPGGNAGTETALVESSDDQGATWQSLRYGVGVALPAPAQQATVIDWDIDPNTARLYRVTITTAGGLQSAPSVPVEAIVSPDAPWLLDVLQPDAGGRLRLPRLRTGGVSPGGVPSVLDWQEVEQMASAYGLDEAFPVTTRGTIQGRTTTLMFYADSLTQYQALRALRKRQRTLRLVLPGFDSAYVIFGGGATTGGTGAQVTYSQLRTGDPGHPVFAIQVPLAEASPP